MYKLLIVDDNRIQRETLLKLVDWAYYDITEIETAEDGEQGLTVFQSFQPHIVITDVVMPGMDGLSMLREMRKLSETTKFICVSCYGDYQYLKDAINSEAIAYILKPINRVELEECLCRFSNKQNRQREIEEMERVLQDGLRLFRENFLYKMLFIKNIDINELSKELANLQLIGYEHFAVAKFCVVNDSKCDNMYRLIALLKSDSLYLDMQTVVVSQSECVVVVLFMSAAGNAEGFRDMVDRMIVYYTQAAEEQHMQLGFGVSGVYDSLVHISLILRDADNSFENNAIMSDMEYVPNPNNYLYVDYTILDLQDALETLIQNNDETQFGLFMNTYCPEEVCSGKYAMHMVCIMTYSAFQLILMGRNLDISEFFGGWRETLSKLSGFSSAEELREWFMKIIRGIINYIKMSELETGRKLALDISAYIEKHYAEIVNVSEVANQFCVSYSYARKIYRNHMEMSLSDKLREVRMNEAKRLLANKNVLVQEAAERVGYRSKQCFSETFKKYTGLLPSEYQMKNGGV